MTEIIPLVMHYKTGDQSDLIKKERGKQILT